MGEVFSLFLKMPGLNTCTYHRIHEQQQDVMDGRSSRMEVLNLIPAARACWRFQLIKANRTTSSATHSNAIKGPQTGDPRPLAVPRNSFSKKKKNRYEENWSQSKHTFLETSLTFTGNAQKARSLRLLEVNKTWRLVGSTPCTLTYPFEDNDSSSFFSHYFIASYI